MTVKVDGINKTIRFIERTAQSVVVGTALEAESELRNRTPVDTGYAKNSWITTTSPDDAGNPGNNSEAEKLAELKRTKLGYTIYINNGAEYIEALEKGHSDQAPHGMVQVTLPEVPDIAQGQIEDAKRANR